jgi:choline dehydrogenase-like flavoprotein
VEYAAAVPSGDGTNEDRAHGKVQYEIQFDEVAAPLASAKTNARSHSGGEGLSLTPLHCCGLANMGVDAMSVMDPRREEHSVAGLAERGEATSFPAEDAQ